MGSREQEQIPEKDWTVRDIAWAIGNDNINSVRSLIGKLRKIHPEITPNRIPNDTGKIVNAYQESAAQHLIQLLWPKSKKRESPKTQEFLTLNDGDIFPLLRGEKQEEASKLLADARNKRQPFSKQRLKETLYPDDSSKIADPKVRFLIYHMNKQLEPNGWMIKHPIYIDSYGREIKIRGFYEVLREGELPTVRESIVKPRRKKPSPNQAPPLLKSPLKDVGKNSAEKKTEPIELPPSGVIWESEKSRGKRPDQEKLDQLRHALILQFTRSFLSHIKVGTMEEFAKGIIKRPKQSLATHVPRNVSHDLVLGIDPKLNKKEKNRKAVEFFVEGCIQTINRLGDNRLSEQQLSLVTIPEERKIIEQCKELEEKGIDKNTALNAVVEQFGFEIPHEPESMAA